MNSVQKLINSRLLEINRELFDLNNRIQENESNLDNLNKKKQKLISEQTELRKNR